LAGEERIVARRAIALADSQQNIGRSFWFALEHFVTNYTYFCESLTVE
jgi:hypothetical protein